MSRGGVLRLLLAMMHLMNLATIIPQAKVDLKKVTVRALAAGTQANMGEVPSRAADGRFTFRLVGPGAGRYEISW